MMAPLASPTRGSPTLSVPRHAPSATPLGVVASMGEANGVGPATGPVRQDLLVDGKVVRASYNLGCQERFVHVTAVTPDAQGERQRFIVGARPTVLDRNGEWGATLSLLDTLIPVPAQSPVLVSGDAGVCVEEHGAWLYVQNIFYLFRIKANAGHLFDRVIDWAETARARRPDGDFFEATRVSGAAIHSRRLWRLPGLRFASFPGITEAFVVEKKSAEASAVPELQYYITSYPRVAWRASDILERILLHWDTETGVFGVKDGTFDEDAVRYKYLEGAMAHVVLLNTVMNCLWAPVLAAWWLPNTPLAHRIQFLRDHPDYCPIQPP